MADGTRQYLEFFRVDQSAQTRRFLVPGVLLLTLGPPMIIVSAALRKFPGSHLMGFAGAAIMVVGLVISFGGILVLLFDERFVAVVEEGVVVHIGAGSRAGQTAAAETFHAWDEVEQIRVADDGAAILVVLRDPELAPVEVPFSRSTAKDVAARLEDWRRKAAWNLAPGPGA